MGRKFSPASLAMLVAATGVAWIVVAVELSLTNAVTPFAMAVAVVLTIVASLWPALASPGEGAKPCRECGSTVTIPGVQFCIICGAYPKRRPA